MTILYLMIPLSIALIALGVWAFLWAIRSGQFDDMEGPAYRILMDDDSPPTGEATPAQRDQEDSDSD
jgi:cbb3-type cytochrome oxidase maturation protein